MERPNIFAVVILNRRFGLFVCFLPLLLLGAFVGSGTAGAWEVAKKQNGILVYTRHIKGSDFKEYKAVMNVKASLSNIAAVVADVAAYPSWVHTCREGKLLKKMSEKESYNYTINEAPWPVKDRDAVVHNKVSQNPDDRMVIIDIKGIPDYIPEKTGLQRVKKIDGFWRLIPLGNGSVEVLYQVHTEPGGNLPSWLVNSIVVSQPFHTLVNMKKQLTQPKYRDARYEFIKD